MISLFHAHIDSERPSLSPRKRLKLHWMAKPTSFEITMSERLVHPKRAMLAAYRARELDSSSDTSSIYSSSSSSSPFARANVDRTTPLSDMSHLTARTLVAATAPPSRPVKLPNRRHAPDTPVFRYLWAEHDKAKSAHTEAVKTIKDIVEDCDRRLGLPSRRRTEAQALEDLWVEGPRATGAAVTYHKTKRRYALVQSLISDQIAKSSSPGSNANSVSPTPSDLSRAVSPDSLLSKLPEETSPDLVDSASLILPLTNDISQAAASIRFSKRLASASPSVVSQSTSPLKRSSSPMDDDLPTPTLSRKRRHLS